jgi:mannose-6-phosphate isomerase-like protein (cupin superfamily)
MHTTLKIMRERLAASGHLFEKAFSDGNMYVELYKPDKVDLQKPHTQDELYVIVQGNGTFINGETRHTFGPGDVIFVRAGVEHRFVDFTDDFETWVIFY